MSQLHNTPYGIGLGMSQLIKRSHILYTNPANWGKYNLYANSTSQVMTLYYLDKIVAKIITMILTNIVKGTKIQLLHSQPQFIHSINHISILVFIYIPKSSREDSSQTDMINRIMNNSKVLQLLLGSKSLYNREVKINYIVLQYNYIDSNIYSQTISQIIGRYNIYRGKYNSIQDKNIVLTNSTNILAHRYNTLNKLSSYAYKLYVYNTLAGRVDNNLYMSNIIRYMLINQYITGYNMIYKGKQATTESNARALLYSKSSGSFNTYNIANISNRNDHNLGLYRYNTIVHNTPNTNINGLYNVRINMAHI
jgi:Mitochondrial ribosomal protein (VAR1)